MTEHPTPEPTPNLARLARNAKLYRYDKTLDEAADLFDTDVAAWSKLPVDLQDRSGMYRDARDTYRRAIAAGAIPKEEQ